MASSLPHCICIFSALYLPSVGGVETYTAHLAQALAAHDFRVLVVTENTHGLPERESSGNVETLRLPCRNVLGGRFPLSHKNDEYRRLWAWLEDQSIEFVVVNTRFYPLSHEGLAFAQHKSIIPVLIEHGSAHLTMGNPLVDAGVRAVEHTMTKRALRFPISCYAVSRKSSAWLAHFGIESHGELSNSIDADRYLEGASQRTFREELGLPPNIFIVASIGRLVKEKGVLELAQASQLIGNEDGIVVLVAGDGVLRAELDPFESDNFHLLGKLNREDAAALLSQANVLCLPSRSEGFATTLLEAAACWTPAIVTNVGGTDELIPDDRYGTVIDDANPQTVARALRDAASNSKHTTEQGRNVGQLVRAKYSWEHTAQQVIEACQQAQTNNSA